MALYIFTNVGRGNLYRQARAFIVSKSIAKTYGRRGWAEIGESDGRGINEPRLLNLAFPLARWNRIGIDTHTPITFPKKQDFIAKTVRAAEGRPGGWPDKYWVKVQYNDDHVVHYNGHMPPGAFNADNSEKYEHARREEWLKMWDKLEASIYLDLGQDYNVIVSLDANRQGDMPKPHPRAVLVAHHKTDYIFAIPAKNRKVRVKSKGSKELGIDFHRAIYADVFFDRTSNN